jgi:antitoxin component of MazEF toxin-antitoxin module
MLSIKRKLHGQGGSLVLVIPRIYAIAKGLKPDDVVEVQLNDFLTIKPVKAGDKPK